MSKIFNRVFLKIVFLEIDHYNSKGLICALLNRPVYILQFLLLTAFAQKNFVAELRGISTFVQKTVTLRF